MVAEKMSGLRYGKELLGTIQKSEFPVFTGKIEHAHTRPFSTNSKVAK